MQVHLALVRYHEGGRFCGQDGAWDRGSALFHLEHAADLGELEAIVGLGLLYSQLPHHILAEVALQVRPSRLPYRSDCREPGSSRSERPRPGHFRRVPGEGRSWRDRGTEGRALPGAPRPEQPST